MTTSFARLLAACALIAALALALPSLASRFLGAGVAGRAANVDSGAQGGAMTGSRRVTINADTRGHFVTLAVIDGFEVKALIDTGATTFALTEETAHKVGIRLSANSFTRPIATANGVVAAAPVTLSRVQIGNVSVLGVPAVVVPGDALGVDLIGMSFLRRLSGFESSGDRLMLTQ